jgi:hypothetical protein
MSKLNKLQILDIEGNDFGKTFDTEDIHAFLDYLGISILTFFSYKKLLQNLLEKLQ